MLAVAGAWAAAAIAVIGAGLLWLRPLLPVRVGTSGNAAAPVIGAPGTLFHASAVRQGERGGGRRQRGQRRRVAARVAILAAVLLLSACGTTLTRSRITPFVSLGLSGPAAPRLDPSLAVLARDYLSHMTLDEKLGQLFVVELVGAEYTPDNAAMVEQLHAGGILLYNREMPNFTAARNGLISTFSRVPA